jgi:hypothetical protein
VGANPEPDEIVVVFDGKRFWSARVGLRYRALAVEDDDGLVWFWIGSHAEYDAFVR